MSAGQYSEGTIIRKIYKAVATVTIVSVITRVLSFFFKVYLSRILGAEMLGVYQISISVFTLFACLSSSGLPTTLSRKTAEKFALNDERSARSIFTSCLIFSLVLSCGILVIFLLFRNLASLFFTDSRCSDMFVLLLPALVSTAIYSITRGWFWGRKDYNTYSFTELLQEALSIASIGLTIVTGLLQRNSMQTLAFAVLVSDYLCALVLVALFFVKGGRLARPRYGKEILKSALPLTTTRLLGSLVSSAMALLLPVMLVKYGSDTAAATAAYGRAGGMIMPLIFAPGTIIGSLAVVLIPEIATSGARDGKSVGRSASNSFIFALLVTGIFLAIYTACGKEMCVMLYGDAVAGDYLEVGAIMMLPMGLNQIAISILNTLGKENKTFASHIAGCVILMAGIFVLPKYIGIYAYFVSLTAFHTLTLCINLFFLSKEVNYDRKMWLNGALLAVFPLTAGYTIRLLLDRLHYNAFLTVVVVSAFLLVVYALFLIKFGFIDVAKFRGKARKKLSRSRV